MEEAFSSCSTELGPSFTPLPPLVASDSAPSTSEPRNSSTSPISPHGILQSQNNTVLSKDEEKDITEVETNCLVKTTLDAAKSSPFRSEKYETYWVQCDKCDKWRRLPNCTDEEYKVIEENDRWECRNNRWDIYRSRCDAPEEESENQSIWSPLDQQPHINHGHRWFSNDIQNSELKLQEEKFCSNPSLEITNNIRFQPESNIGHTLKLCTSQKALTPVNSKKRLGIGNNRFSLNSLSTASQDSHASVVFSEEKVESDAFCASQNQYTTQHSPEGQILCMNSECTSALASDDIEDTVDIRQISTLSGLSQNQNILKTQEKCNSSTFSSTSLNHNRKLSTLLPTKATHDPVCLEIKSTKSKIRSQKPATSNSSHNCFKSKRTNVNGGKRKKGETDSTGSKSSVVTSKNQNFKIHEPQLQLRTSTQSSSDNPCVIGDIVSTENFTSDSVDNSSLSHAQTNSSCISIADIPQDVNQHKTLTNSSTYSVAFPTEFNGETKEQLTQSNIQLTSPAHLSLSSEFTSATQGFHILKPSQNISAAMRKLEGSPFGFKGDQIIPLFQKSSDEEPFQPAAKVLLLQHQNQTVMVPAIETLKPDQVTFYADQLTASVDYTKVFPGLSDTHHLADTLSTGVNTPRSFQFQKIERDSNKIQSESSQEVQKYAGIKFESTTPLCQPVQTGLGDLQNVTEPLMVNWAQCETCRKWRCLPAEIDPDSLPDKWYCSMNLWDKAHQTCDAQEEDYADTKKPEYAARADGQILAQALCESRKKESITSHETDSEAVALSSSTVFSNEFEQGKSDSDQSAVLPIEDQSNSQQFSSSRQSVYPTLEPTGVKLELSHIQSSFINESKELSTSIDADSDLSCLDKLRLSRSACHEGFEDSPKNLKISIISGSLCESKLNPLSGRLILYVSQPIVSSYVAHGLAPNLLQITQADLSKIETKSNSEAISPSHALWNNNNSSDIFCVDDIKSKTVEHHAGSRFLSTSYCGAVSLDFASRSQWPTDQSPSSDEDCCSDDIGEIEIANLLTQIGNEFPHLNGQIWYDYGITQDITLESVCTPSDPQLCNNSNINVNPCRIVDFMDAMQYLSESYKKESIEFSNTCSESSSVTNESVSKNNNNLNQSGVEFSILPLSYSVSNSPEATKSLVDLPILDAKETLLAEESAVQSQHSSNSAQDTAPTPDMSPIVTAVDIPCEYHDEENDFLPESEQTCLIEESQNALIDSNYNSLCSNMGQKKTDLSPMQVSAHHPHDGEVSEFCFGLNSTPCNSSTTESIHYVGNDLTNLNLVRMSESTAVDGSNLSGSKISLKNSSLSKNGTVHTTSNVALLSTNHLTTEISLPSDIENNTISTPTTYDQKLTAPTSTSKLTFSSKLCDSFSAIQASYAVSGTVHPSSVPVYIPAHHHPHHVCSPTTVPLPSAACALPTMHSLPEPFKHYQYPPASVELSKKFMPVENLQDTSEGLLLNMQKASSHLQLNPSIDVKSATLGVSDSSLTSGSHTSLPHNLPAIITDYSNVGTISNAPIMQNRSDICMLQPFIGKSSTEIHPSLLCHSTIPQVMRFTGTRPFHSGIPFVVPISSSPLESNEKKDTTSPK